jgi:hypothetical protein
MIAGLCSPNRHDHDRFAAAFVQLAEESTRLLTDTG